MQSSHSLTIAGTTSGTLLTILVNIQTEDLIKTAVLSLTGAVISFVVSVGLRWISRRLKGRGSN